MSTPIFNNLIRLFTVGFGNLFKDIQILRYDVDGSEAERFLVPIQYASKEKYVARLEGDPNLDRKIQISLPAMSFEMNGMTYDTTRKQITNVKNFAQTSSGVQAQYNPVPYNLDYSLYIYVRNEEDGNQIIERILPYFTPDYTIKLNLIPLMGVVRDIPIVLNNVSYENDYQGNMDSSTRVIIWTLNFTVKGFIYGNVNSAELITHSITNIYNDITQDTQVVFNLNPTSGVGEYQQGEIVYQGYSLGTATATAKVIVQDTTNNNLTLTNLNGNFVSSLPLIGAKTNASYKYTSSNSPIIKYAEVDITPSPNTANAISKYTYNTIITEI
jgi:hypothetical protein